MSSPKKLWDTSDDRRRVRLFDRIALCRLFSAVDSRVVFFFLFCFSVLSSSNSASVFTPTNELSATALMSPAPEEEDVYRRNPVKTAVIIVNVAIEPKVRFWRPFASEIMYTVYMRRMRPSSTHKWINKRWKKNGNDFDASSAVGCRCCCYRVSAVVGGAAPEDTTNGSHSTSFYFRFTYRKSCATGKIGHGNTTCVTNLLWLRSICCGILVYLRA